MPLPLIVDTLDSVPEQLRSNYVQQDGKFRLDVDGYEDPSNLKSALQKEREAARQAEKQAKAWAGLGKTPEEIQALVEAQRKADEERLTKAGEWDKLKQQMNDAAAQERAALEQKLQGKDKAIERYLVDAQATAAIAELKGVAPLLLPHVKAAVKVVEDNGEFVVRVVDQSGSPRVNGKGEFLSIRDLVSEMRQSEIFGRAFEPTGTAGSGASNSGSHGSKTMSQEAFLKLPPKERAKRMQDGYSISG